MSDSLTVFIRSDHLPTIDELRNAMKNYGLELETWEVDSLQDIVGYWPGVYKNEEAGFEFILEKLDDDDLESLDVGTEELEGRDFVLDLAFRTELDLTASALCAVYFCKKCDGITFDDNEELTVNSTNCDDWLNNYI